MSYYFTKTYNMSFDEALGKVSDELKKEGFGILAKIDAKETLKDLMYNEMIQKERRRE